MSERTKGILLGVGLVVLLVGAFNVKCQHTKNQDIGQDKFLDGVAAMKSGDEERAIELFSETIRLGNTAHSILSDYQYSLAPAYYNRGLAHLRKPEPDPDLALLDFTEALRIDDTLGRCHWGRGKAYQMKMDLAAASVEYDKAILLASLAIQKDANDADAYDLRADAYEAKGDKERAQLDRQRAGRAASMPIQQHR